MKSNHLRIIPGYISSLAPNEIFVFGSNLAGHHCSGAAGMAREKFGAVWGQGVGLQGQSYAIPTMQGGIDTTKQKIFLSTNELKYLLKVLSNSPILKQEDCDVDYNPYDSYKPGTTF